MQVLEIRFNAKGFMGTASINDLHVVLDGKDVGVLSSGKSGRQEISDTSHNLRFVYYIPAIGGDDVPISSDEIKIPPTYDTAPEKLEYIFDVSLVHTSNIKENMKASFSQIFMSKQQQINLNANRNFKICVEQDPANIQEVQRKQKLNMTNYKVEKIMENFAKQIVENMFEPLDFTEFDKLSDEEKHCPYMNKIYVPHLVDRMYSELVRHYLDDEISMPMMFLELEQLTHIPYANDIIGNSLKHKDYLCSSGNNLNSVLHGNAIEELQKLRNGAYELVRVKLLDRKEMRDRWNNREQHNFIRRDNAVGKSLFDEIVNVDRDVKYFDDLKRTILIVAMIESEQPELSGALPDLKLAMEETFGPIVYHEGKPLKSVTVDMLIADAIHNSKVNSIEKINDSLSTFLNVLCKENDVGVEQYNILQEVFAWLKAYKQEAMVLEAMVSNGIARTKEQDNRLAFLNSNKKTTSGNSAISFGETQSDIFFDKKNDDNILIYDYSFMSMNDSELSEYFNNLSMENRTIDHTVVVEEWANSVEIQGVTWNDESIKNSIDNALKQNFGDKFIVSIKNCGVFSDGWSDNTPAIVISATDEQSLPWLSYIIIGEQIILNQMNISIYALYRPELDSLSQSIYERNQQMEKKIVMLRKKQNPKINTLIQIVTNLLVKELEIWVNSQKVQNIYE